MNCTECFMRDGNPARVADFVINGQSLCQKHAHVAIRYRSQAPLYYTWQLDDEMEPRLESADPNRSFL